MKNIFKLLAVLTIFSSCTQDILEDINKNPNAPTDVPAKFIITDAIVQSAMLTGADYAFYASAYIEHNVGIYGQLYNAERRVSEPTAATTYNNSWGSSYENIYNLKIAIDKCKNGNEQGNNHTLAVAQILTAYNLALLTDLMGDVPYKEALQPGVILQPKADKQEEIYKEVFALLDSALINIDKPSTYPKWKLDKQDILFGDKKVQWKQFANGLKARYSARLSFVKKYGAEDWQKVITLIDSSFVSSSKDGKFKFNGGTTYNPFFRFFRDRDYFGASESLHEKLISRNDPRDNVFFIKHPRAQKLVFAPNGKPEQAQQHYGVSGLLSATAPGYLLSYHELLFLKAEALARISNNVSNDEITTTLNLAVKEAFLKVGLTADIANTYFEEKVLPLCNQDPLKEIFNQKYLAFYEIEAVEAYNDIRRLKAEGKNYIELANPNNNEKFPLRYVYGNSDVTTNSNMYDLFVSTNIYKMNVWWAGGTQN